MTDEEATERRHDYQELSDRLLRVEIGQQHQAEAIHKLDEKLVNHAIREEEAAVHREQRLSEKLEGISKDLRTLQDEKLQRNSRHALLAMLGAGLVAIATILIQAITGLRH